MFTTFTMFTGFATSTGPVPTCWWSVLAQAALAKAGGAGGDVAGLAFL
ncbi:hypothetical protein [Plasticicumulans sp.]